ncbi:hypothetical protein AAFF_G00408270 [Aldrovandia affinis]|uniref:Uncharacterized protein n=1 Tax=Aldrovandia affinis TaxID=143900 RepID=A0AAD7SBS6_9TELE|nr:hypothetical protein AAFF_G00408270 [Aldrovandia affinis]
MILVPSTYFCHPAIVFTPQIFLYCVKPCNSMFWDGYSPRLVMVCIYILGCVGAQIGQPSGCLALHEPGPQSFLQVVLSSSRRFQYSPTWLIRRDPGRVALKLLSN